MSNIFINRNRSQGDYGPKRPSEPRVNTEPIFQTPNQTWLMRAQKEKERQAKNERLFYETSLKYHKKPDLQKKYVGIPWTIVDSC